MLGFILSKLNLLILVVSIFAIVSFFTFGLTDLVKINEARIILDRISQKSFALVSSPSYCFSDSFDLPERISVGGEPFYYVMKISVEKIRIENPPAPESFVSVVIFSIHPRAAYVKYAKGETDKEPPSVAASSFRTPAQVRLYSEEYTGTNYVPALSTVVRVSLFDSSDDTFTHDPDQKIEGIIVDPQAETKFSTVEFLKEVRGGKSYVYIFPCSIEGSADHCKITKQDVEKLACDEIDGTVDPDACDGLEAGDPGVWFSC